MITSTHRLPSTSLLITRDLTLAYVSSLVVAVLMVIVSVVDLMQGASGHFGVDPKAAAALTPSIAGILVPGFLAHDLFNLAIGLPILLASLWLARRGALIGLLLWPGALFYVLYTYTSYLISAPFSVLFLLYVALVTLSAHTIIGILVSVDYNVVRQRYSGIVPARTVGGILVGLAFLTIAQDASGAIVTALTATVPIVPMARHVWITDLVVVVPAMVLGGILLWRRKALGYVVSPGLLLQFGVTPLILAGILALQPFLTASQLEVSTIIGLLVFSAVSFAPLVFFMRGVRSSLPLTNGVNPRKVLTGITRGAEKTGP
jgi:hypothetical protein